MSKSKHQNQNKMSRHFENPYSDFANGAPDEFLDSSTGRLSDEFVERIERYEVAKLDHLTRRLGARIFEDDCVFTGSAGIGLLHYLCAKRRPARREALLLAALEYVRIRERSRPRVTFLCGAAGPLALGTVVAHSLGNSRPPSCPEPERLAQSLEKLWSVARAPDTPDELLYGRAGYLHSLLFVNKETGRRYFSPALISEVIGTILDSGVRLGENLGSRFNVPLMYRWHDSFYLGGAHGHAGILYMILQAREYVTQEQLGKLIVPTLDWLLALRFKDGNLPSSFGREQNKLVQWCHGAPGFVQLCRAAYEIFHDQKYLDAALACGEVVWNRGLCTKGYSICHGVAGNAYTFLELYQLTRDLKHLYRACCFADWCIKEKPGTETHEPDAPASLFEGLAGRLYLVVDILDPMNAKFPGFTL